LFLIHTAQQISSILKITNTPGNHLPP